MFETPNDYKFSFAAIFESDISILHCYNVLFSLLMLVLVFIIIVHLYVVTTYTCNCCFLYVCFCFLILKTDIQTYFYVEKLLP